MIQTLKPSRTARIRMGNAHLEGISSGSAAVLTDSSAPEHVNKGAENATVPYFANMSDKRQKNLEDKMSFGNKNGGASAFWLACYIFLWISSSVIGTITNKKIMKVFPFPVSLSVIHIISGGLMDGFLLIQRQLPVFLNRDIMTGSIPVALCLAVGKILTYFSYGKIPVSLTHTVKVKLIFFSFFGIIYD